MPARLYATVVLLAVIYEWVGIHWRWWPTFTALIRPHRGRVWFALLVTAAIAAIAGWAVAHLLFGSDK